MHIYNVYIYTYINMLYISKKKCIYNISLFTIYLFFFSNILWNKSAFLFSKKMPNTFYTKQTLNKYSSPKKKKCHEKFSIIYHRLFWILIFNYPVISFFYKSCLSFSTQKKIYKKQLKLKLIKLQLFKNFQQHLSAIFVIFFLNLLFITFALRQNRNSTKCTPAIYKLQAPPRPFQTETELTEQHSICECYFAFVFLSRLTLMRTPPPPSWESYTMKT